MIDRSVNLLVLLVVVAAIAILADGLHHAWNTTPPWDREWTSKPDLQPSRSADQILTAIKKATEAQVYTDAERLEQILERFYAPGDVTAHISPAELYKILLKSFAILLLLAVPLSINYVRHGGLRLWNHGT